MKKSFLLYFLIPFAFSCTSSYKSLQTPDDVYYSPAFLRTDSVRHDHNNENNHSVNNSGPTIIYRNYPPYHGDYDDDYYYYNRRSKGYYQPDVYVTTPKTVSKARTTNLKVYETHKSTDYLNRKINQQTIPSTAPASINSSEKVRKFPKTGGTVLGKAMRSIVNNSIFQSASRGSNSSSSNSSKSSSSPATTDKSGSKAARHR